MRRNLFFYTLFRDLCPICNKRGRFRLRYTIYLNKGINYNSIEIQHFKWEENKKKYSHTCWIFGKENIMKYKLPPKEILLKFQFAKDEQPEKEQRK